MHAAQGSWDEVAKLRRGMRERGARKEPGCSWIKYKNRVYIFSADDQFHPDSEKIAAELLRLSSEMEEEGYKPDTTSVLHDVEESEERHIRLAWG
nr:pentatricopeptide repeat protein AaPPR847 [Agave angustifolia]